MSDLSVLPLCVLPMHATNADAGCTDHSRSGVPSRPAVSTATPMLMIALVLGTSAIVLPGSIPILLHSANLIGPDVGGGGAGGSLHVGVHVNAVLPLYAPMDVWCAGFALM